MDRKLLYTLLAFAVIVLSFFIIIYLLTPFLASIVWAIVLSMATSPLHRWFLKITKGKENFSACLSTFSVFILIAIPLILIFILFTSQAYEILSYIEDSVHKGEIPIVHTIKSNKQVVEFMEKLKPYFKEEEIYSFGLAVLKRVGNIFALLSKKLTMNIFSAFFQFLMTILFLFFAFRDGEKIVQVMWEIVPIKEKDKERIVDILKRIISAVLYGIVLACIVQGIMGGIGFYIAGIKSAVFYGTLITIFSFVPVIGSTIIWVPAVIYLLANGEYGKAVFLFIWCLTIVSMVDNVIRPLYISGKSKINLMIVVIGVIGGLLTLGFLGIIVGPFVLSLFVEIVRIYKEEVVLSKEALKESPVEEGG